MMIARMIMMIIITMAISITITVVSIVIVIIDPSGRKKYRTVALPFELNTNSGDSHTMVVSNE